MICLLVAGWYGVGYGQGKDTVVVRLDNDNVALPDYSEKVVAKIVRCSKDGFTRSVKINNGADLSHSIFLDNIDFFNTIFLEKAYFSSATFSEEAHFTAATFSKKAEFSDAAFSKEAYFAGVTFSAWPDFSHANFSKEAYFSNATFSRGAMFYGTTFSKEVAFSDITFSEKSYFSSTTFSERVDFSGLQLSEDGYLIFSGCHLPETIDFSHISSIKNEINLIDIAFDSSRFGPNGNSHLYNILLYGSDVSKFHLNYTYFRLLPLGYDGKELPRDEAISLYEQLLKNFKDRGQWESYQKLDIEYQQYKWRTGPKIIRWFGYVSDGWWRFGYARQRVFMWAFGLLILFSFLTLPMLPFLQREVYPLEAISKIQRPYYHWRRRLWYSFVYTGTLFFKLTLKTEKICFGAKARHIWGTLYVLLVYVVGIVCLAYMANFVLQK